MNNPSRASVLVALLALGWSAGAWGQQIMAPGQTECLDKDGCLRVPPFQTAPLGDCMTSANPCMSKVQTQTAHECEMLSDGQWWLCFASDGITSWLEPVHAVRPDGTSELLSPLRQELSAAVADDDAGAIATLEAAVQTIKRRHPNANGR